MKKYFNSVAFAAFTSLGILVPLHEAQAESFSCTNNEKTRAAEIDTDGKSQGFVSLYVKDEAYKESKNVRKVFAVEGKIDFRTASSSAKAYCETGKLPSFESQILPAGPDGLRALERYSCNMGIGKNVARFYYDTRDYGLFSSNIRSRAFLEVGVNNQGKFQSNEKKDDPSLDRSGTIKLIERHCGIN